ncbi:Nicotinamidase-related amidase [Thermomonospora echinospora]|uniref:Nicotinamidase-related amidase n=1 Tax=Thermomonospora echinospora TaxID=1992 RepID=A0A1H6DUU2_9ACTN|nr:isochorismatase family protein [Thermomonospora echinospora]SEG88814.1 Nicotinamidase-related amidase [Thermomonospora echinospora]
MSAWIAQTRERYEQGGLAGRLTWGRRPAVVVVDLQAGFTDPACPPGSDLDDVVARTAEVVERATAVGAPVFLTTIAYPPEELDRLVWLRKMPAMRALTEGSKWVEIDERLPVREPVIVKKAASAFAGTDLAGRLAAERVDTLVVCGATTSGCVRATAVDACAANLAVFVPRECVGDRAPGPHEASLLDIDAKYGDVIGVEEVLARW